MRKIKDASEKMVGLCSDCDEQNLSPKQAEVVKLLKMAGEVSLKEIIYFTGYTKAVVDALVKKTSPAIMSVR